MASLEPKAQSEWSLSMGLWSNERLCTEGVVDKGTKSPFQWKHQWCFGLPSKVWVELEEIHGTWGMRFAGSVAFAREVP